MKNTSRLFLFFCIFESIAALPQNEYYDFEKGSSKETITILGINLWIFITVVSIPFIFIFFCLWCWCIGRNSAKAIEENKKRKYLYEHSQNTKHKKNSQDESDTSSTAATVKKVINPQKEVKEEISKHGKKSHGNTAKIYSKNDLYEDTSVDLASIKIESSKTSVTSSPIIKEKQKKTNLPSPLLNFDGEKPRRPKKVNATAKIASRIDPSIPPTPISMASIETASIHSTQSNSSKKKSGKNKTGKKKVEQSQVNVPTVIAAPPSPYLNHVGGSTINSQLYYQQMYNAAAAQVANPYYAAYNQNPYYGSPGVNMVPTLTKPYNTSPYLGVMPITKTKIKK
ncbi:hypothetical protein BCR36DRAFT_416127 [Piromyces finnis]|uniref:Uncharacterized protein n=1 Tax=Piromyces finnis TaxID=1754191 RepID=A0A1Y1UYJ9_9FUNG|nr:hypothetical protein BCR36DRAFT_416127 [Piromyces finnis]|eukprot:ORX42378.1 hypothetical protein BCR36DRAFT_416127 [Piromyces finnis]